MAQCGLILNPDVFIVELNKESNVKELFMVLECIGIILNGNSSHLCVYCDRERIEVIDAIFEHLS